MLNKFHKAPWKLMSRNTIAKLLKSKEEDKTIWQKYQKQGAKLHAFCLCNELCLLKKGRLNLFHWLVTKTQRTLKICYHYKIHWNDKIQSKMMAWNRDLGTNRLIVLKNELCCFLPGSIEKGMLPCGISSTIWCNVLLAIITQASLEK